MRQTRPQPEQYLPPHVDEILTAFFDAQLVDKTGLRRRRIEAAGERLRACLESDGEQVLGDGDRTLLAAEREFFPGAAFGRAMHAEHIIFALCLFVGDRWMPRDRVDRRVQLRFADALGGFIVGRRLIDIRSMMSALWALRAAIDAGLCTLKESADG
jgi:hypothetical protein